MGRGNVCVSENYGGLYYVDYDNLACFYEKENPSNIVLQGSVNDFAKFEYDQIMSDEVYSDFKHEFIKAVKGKFKSFDEPYTQSNHVWLENELFSIEVEDNEWSLAVKLLPKEQEYGQMGNLEALQKRHYLNYLKGIAASLLERYESIGIYTGPWTSGVLTRKDILH